VRAAPFVDSTPEDAALLAGISRHRAYPQPSMRT
jgi:hypothetical protein